MISFPRRSLLIGALLLSALSLRAADQAIPPIETIENPTPAFQKNEEVQAETHRLVAARDMDGLEKLANDLRESRARLDGGTWILSSYLDAIGHLPKDDKEAAATMGFYERWAQERPESMTAQISYAEGLTSYAWRARGSGWGSEVTEDGWKFFRERLKTADLVLMAVKDRAVDYPDWTEAAQTVALGQSWPRQKYMDMVNAAIVREPTYGRYYTSACYYLLPRWHGEAGDFERWLREMAEKYPPEQRDRAYAFFVWMAERMPVRGEIAFAHDRLDWEMTKRGFEQWLQEGDNLMVRFEFIRLGLIADDRATVREQFDHIGGKYWPKMWKNEDQFKAALAYAYTDGPNPQIDKSSRKPSKKVPEMSAEAIAMIKTAAHHLLGFLGGLLAGSLLLTMAFQRSEKKAGALILVASLILGTALGTMATLIPALGLFLHLRGKKQTWPPRPTGPHGGMVFLWIVVVGGSFLGLQIVGSIFTYVPMVMENLAKPNIEEITRSLMSDGSTARLVIASGWISLLLLLTICGPLNRTDWQLRLGLHSIPIGRGALYTAGALVLTIILSYVTTSLMDQRSLDALKLMALGIHSPISYYLAIALVAPVLEELLFRGYAYSGWIGKIGFWPTALITSFIFAICHIQYGWAGLLFVFGFGFTMASLRRLSGSIYPCIIVHFLLNFANCLLHHLGVESI